MSAKNKNILTRWYQEGWNQGREEVIDEVMHPDVKAYGLAGEEPVVGIGAFREFYRGFRQMVSDIHISIDNNLADGDYVTVLCTLTGIHVETGSPIKITGSSTGLLQDGLIVAAWNSFDFLTFNLQIGKITSQQLA